MSLRKVNKTTPERPVELATEIRKFRKLVQEAILTGKIKRSEVANLDETAVQAFALTVRTLHHRGAKSVGGSKRDSSKLSLSVTVVWWADGRMDLVIVFRSDAKTLPTWEKIRTATGDVYHATNRVCSSR